MKLQITYPLFFLICLIATTIATVPEFDKEPHFSKTSTTMRSQTVLCGTFLPNEFPITCEWQLYDWMEDMFVTKFSECCAMIGDDLGIETEDDLDENNTFIFRMCASNQDGTICSRNGTFTLVERQSESDIRRNAPKNLPEYIRRRSTL